MIKEALQYIVGLGEANLLDVEGYTYSDKPLEKVSYIPYPEPIKLKTLSSFVEYIKNFRECEMADGKAIVHVESPTKVRIYSALDKECNRDKYAIAEAELPYMEFGTFENHESFCIALQSKFVDNEDRRLLLKFAGTVQDGTVTEYGDDGVSQKATVKTGLSSKSDAIVPNPVILKPFRTFLEVDQPESAFIFRMKNGNYGVQCALFEADGGAWKIEAMKNIKEYLQEELKEVEDLVVIS